MRKRWLNLNVTLQMGRGLRFTYGLCSFCVVFQCIGWSVVISEAFLSRLISTATWDSLQMCQFLVTNTTSYQCTQCVAWNIYQEQEQPEWPTRILVHMENYMKITERLQIFLTTFCDKVPSWWVAFEAWSCPKFRGRIGEISKQVDLIDPRLTSVGGTEPKRFSSARRILWMSQHWLPRGGLNMKGFRVGGPGRPSKCCVFPGLKIGDATKI